MKLMQTSSIRKFSDLQSALEEVKIPSTDADYKIIEDWKTSALLLIEETFGENYCAKQFADRIRLLFTEPLSIGFGSKLVPLSEEDKKNVFETSFTDARAILSECIQLLKD